MISHILPLLQINFTDVATVFYFALMIVNRYVVLKSPVLFTALVGPKALVLLEIVVVALSLILVLVLVLAVELLLSPVGEVCLTDHDEDVEGCKAN